MRLIDGDKVEERLMLLQTNCERNPNQLTSAIWGALEAVREFVREQPNIEPVKRGKWVETSHKDKKRCSVCDRICFIAIYPHFKKSASYCPNCGARMDGGNK